MATVSHNSPRLKGVNCASLKIKPYSIDSVLFWIGNQAQTHSNLPKLVEVIDRQQAFRERQLPQLITSYKKCRRIDSRRDRFKAVRNVRREITTLIKLRFDLEQRVGTVRYYNLKWLDRTTRRLTGPTINKPIIKERQPERETYTMCEERKEFYTSERTIWIQTFDENYERKDIYDWSTK